MSRKRWGHSGCNLSLRITRPKRSRVAQKGFIWFNSCWYDVTTNCPLLSSDRVTKAWIFLCCFLKKQGLKTSSCECAFCSATWLSDSVSDSVTNRRKSLSWYSKLKITSSYNITSQWTTIALRSNIHNPYMMDKATSRDGAASENI